MKIAIFGTFDIGNFGDLLFPIVASAKLKERADVEVVFYSYQEMKHDTWCYDVVPISAFRHRVDEYDLCLVGGGHLIHFVETMAEGYLPPSAEIPHPLGFWWLPAVYAAANGVPVATHCVSVDHNLPDWSEPLMRGFAASIDMITVRDHKSQQKLGSYAEPAVEVQIVPDSIFSIPDLIERGRLSDDFVRFREQIGLGERYVIAQPSYSLRRNMADVLRLARDAQAQGYQVLELPIGHGIGNDIGFYDASLGFKRVETWPNPTLLAEIIANSSASIGISLHLSIVSSAYGIPVFRPRYSEDSKFILLDDFQNIRFLDDQPEFAALGPDASPTASARAAHAALERHWDALIGLARQSSRPASKRTGLWSFFCSLPGAMKRRRSRRDARLEFLANLRAYRGFARRSLTRKLRALFRSSASAHV